MSAQHPAAGFRAIASDDGVSCIRPDGRYEFVAWDEIREIAIITERLDFVGNDVWLLIDAGPVGCAIPQGAEGERGLLFDILPKRFQPFSHQAIIDAMSSVDDAKFTIWTRPA